MKIARIFLWIVAAGIGTTAAVAGIRYGRAPQVAESALMYDTLPFYTQIDLHPRWRGAGDRRIGDFDLRDQNNVSINRHVFERGPTVVNFFFSGCTTICPVSMELLNLTRKDLAAEAPAFVSISVTPLIDDPATLSRYAQRLELPNDWRLVTGSPGEVFALAKSELLTDIETPGPDGQPPHTERALLVDTLGRIRGIYNANEAVDLMRLRYDLRRLRTESRAGG